MSEHIEKGLGHVDGGRHLSCHRDGVSSCGLQEVLKLSKRSTHSGKVELSKTCRWG